MVNLKKFVRDNNSKMHLTIYAYVYSYTYVQMNE